MVAPTPISRTRSNLELSEGMRMSVVASVIATSVLKVKGEVECCDEDLVEATIMLRVKGNGADELAARVVGVW